VSVNGSSRSHDDRRLSAAVDLSNRRFYLGQRKTAQRDLKVACLLEDQPAESIARLELGRALLYLGYIDEAMAELATSADQAEATRNLDCLYQALYSLAAGYLARNDLEGHLACRQKGLIIAERKRDLIEIDYASALLGYALGYLDRNEEAGRYLYRANHPTHGLRAGCTWAGMGVLQAMAKVNRLGLLEIVTVRAYVLSKQNRWAEAHEAIQDGLAASEKMDCYIAETLLALSDRLPKNGF
jgi:tetratricopeptide (TPR) repeat protein